MSTAGQDILARLEAAIAQTEATAAAATAGICPDWIYNAVRHIARNCQVECSHDEHQGWDQPEWDRYEDSPHIQRQSPEAVLRRCAADRRLLQLHRPVSDRYGWGPDDDDTEGAYGHISQACATCGSSDAAVRFPCATILALAEGYGVTEVER